MAHENTYSMSSGVDLYAPGAGLAAASENSQEKKHNSKEKKEKKEKAHKE
jgi:hypothetical protein